MEFGFLYSAAVKAENNIFLSDKFIHGPPSFIKPYYMHSYIHIQYSFIKAFFTKDLKATSLQGQYPDFPAPVSHVSMFSVW